MTVRNAGVEKRLERSKACGSERTTRSCATPMLITRTTQVQSMNLPTPTTRLIVSDLYRDAPTHCDATAHALAIPNNGGKGGYLCDACEGRFVWVMPVEPAQYYNVINDPYSEKPRRMMMAEDTSVRLKVGRYALIPWEVDSE